MIFFDGQCYTAHTSKQRSTDSNPTSESEGSGPDATSHRNARMFAPKAKRLPKSTIGGVKPFQTSNTHTGFLSEEQSKHLLWL